MGKRIDFIISVLIFYCFSIETVFTQQLNLGFGSAIEKGQMRLEQYLHKADVLRETQRWQDMAKEGVSVAMCEWEKYSYLAEDSILKEEALEYFNSQVEQRFSEFLERKFNEEKYSEFYVSIREELEKLSKELEEKNRGSEITAEEAKAQWNSAAQELIDSYLQGNENENNPTLIFNAKIAAESIGNTLILNELFDRESLKVMSDAESASVIANELAESIQKKTDSIVENLFAGIERDISVDEKETMKFVDENWIGKFENEIGKALVSWEEAEKQFLEKMVVWEENARETYSSGIEKWQSAYEEFLLKKENWKKDISSRIENARTEIISIGHGYMDEVASSLMEYEDFLNKKNDSYYEIYNLQKETYTQVRELIKFYKENAESWISIWKDQFMEFYLYCRNKNPSENYYDFYELINNDKIDAGKIDSNYVSKISDQINKMNTLASDYDAIEKIEAGGKDIVYFLNGIAANKNTEKYLSAEILSLSEKIFEDYYTQEDLELNKAKFHLDEINREYEIALAVYNYALSTGNQTENAMDSELNLKSALEELKLAQEIHEKKALELEQEFKKKTERIKKEIENNSSDLDYVSQKLEELSLLNVNHSKAIKELNDENVRLEKLRLNVRKSEAIYDFGTSIYLDKEDAFKNLMEVKDELESAENSVRILEEKKKNNVNLEGDAAIVKIQELKEREELYIASSMILETALEKLESYKINVCDVENEIFVKRHELVGAVRSAPEFSGKYELVRISSDENGNFIIGLDLKGMSGYDLKRITEFFEAADVVKENSVRENDFYTHAEEDLFQWTSKMLSHLDYFDDVVLTALYYVSLNGYLDDVDGQNINPLNRNNTKYVLENVDPDDTLGSIGLYNSYRRESLEEAVRRVQSHSGWESDVARCILYKDTDSLLGKYIDRIETYAMNIVAYDKMYDEYEYKRDDHTFFPGFFGHKFMDSDGKLADSCMDKMSDLKSQAELNLRDIKNKMQEEYMAYEAVIDALNSPLCLLNEFLYNREEPLSESLSPKDFKILAERIYAGSGGKVDEAIFNSIVKKYSNTISGSNIIAALNEINESVLEQKQKSYDEVLKFSETEEHILESAIQMYGELISKNSDKIDYNKSLEGFYGNLFDSLAGVVISESKIVSESQYADYSNELDETIKALERNLYRKYEEVCRIEKYSEDKWKKADENFMSEWNLWVRNFQDEYDEKLSLWNETYSKFIEDRQDYISRNYLEQTTTALNSQMSVADITSMGDYADYYGCNEKIQKAIDSFNIATNAFSISDRRNYDNDYLIETEILQNKILAEQKDVAAKQSAYTAYNLLEKQKKEGLDKIIELNLAQREWEIELVRNKGYSVTGNEINRRVTKGCTLFSVLYQNQSVHMYRDFTPEEFLLTVNLSSVNNLSEEAVKNLIASAYEEYMQWEKKIFGTENSDGDFQKYLGDVPELRSDVDINNDSKENSFSFTNKGEITLILMDLQWNSLEERAGYEDFNKPAWDQKISDASWAPTLRTTTTIAAAVAASVASCGALSAGASVYTAAALSSAVTLSNEISFAALDLYGGYKSPVEIGKSLASSAVSSAIGIATAGVGDKISSIESAAGKIGASALYQGGKVALNISADAYIKNDFNFDDTLDSIMEKAAYAKTIAGIIYGSISTGLDEFNLDSNGQKVSGFSSDNISSIRSFDSFVGETASTIFEYGYTGETSLNLASINGVGLWELKISDDGFEGQVGMNGQNVGLNRIASAVSGLKDIKENYKIENFSKDNSNLASALRMQYGFGNEEAKKQLQDILDGQVLLKASESGYENQVAKSILENGKKVIEVGLDSLESDYKNLGFVLQHEAMRNGIDDGFEKQIIETVSSVLSHTAMVKVMANDPLYAEEISEFIKSNGNISKDIGALENLMDYGLLGYTDYVFENYDVSQDYWRLTWNGQLINDGQGYLKDENGLYVNSDGTHTEQLTSKTLGSNGIESGLLNIIANSSNRAYSSFSDEEVHVAQKLMMDSGMTPSNPQSYFREYNWGTNYKGQKLNMYDFMGAAGKKVNDEIFNLRYNNSADLVLAQRYGVDLGYTKDAADLAIPGELLGKFVDLVNTHGRKTKNGQELIEKYKFEIENSDGSVTSLYKITKDNPYLGKLLGQHDFNSYYNAQSDYYINSVIDKYGCNFMANIAIPQLLTGNFLDKSDVIDIWEDAINTNISGNDDVFFGLVDSDEAIVNDRNKLVQKAMEKLNLDSFYTTYYPLRKSDVYVNDRIGFYKKKANGDLYPYHFTVGDKEGNVVFNPGYGLTDIKKMDKIFVGEKK